MNPFPTGEDERFFLGVSCFLAERASTRLATASPIRFPACRPSSAPPAILVFRPILKASLPQPWVSGRLVKTRTSCGQPHHVRGQSDLCLSTLELLFLFGEFGDQFISATAEQQVSDLTEGLLRGIPPLHFTHGSIVLTLA